jgi:hypothetical protein
MMVTLILLPGLDGTGTLFDAFVAALGTESNVKVVSYPITEPLDYSELEAIARSALARHFQSTAPNRLCPINV